MVMAFLLLLFLLLSRLPARGLGTPNFQVMGGGCSGGKAFARWGVGVRRFFGGVQWVSWVSATARRRKRRREGSGAGEGPPPKPKLEGSSPALGDFHFPVRRNGGQTGFGAGCWVPRTPGLLLRGVSRRGPPGGWGGGGFQKGRREPGASQWAQRGGGCRGDLPLVRGRFAPFVPDLPLWCEICSFFLLNLPLLCQICPLYAIFAPFYPGFALFLLNLPILCCICPFYARFASSMQICPFYAEFAPFFSRFAPFIPDLLFFFL